LVEFTAFRRRFYLLSDPERMHEVFIKKQKHFTKGRGLAVTKTLLGEGLLTSEGDFHLRQRRLTQPAFHRRRISSYADTMVDAAVEHMKTWRDGQSCDIHEEMVALTLDIVGRTLFGADVAKEAGDVSEAVDLLLKAWWIVLLVPALNKLRKVRLPIPVLSQVQNAIDNLDDIIYRLIRERRESGEDHGDLLSMLLQAQDDEGDGGQMTDKQVRDEAMTLFLAGHETTANALSWTWYLLSQHPEVEAKFHEELDRVLGDRPPNFEDLQTLTYTEMILHESMRLFPPAWNIGRYAPEDVQIGDGIIPKDTTILMSPYVVHRDPRWYPEPETFDPMRWTPEKKEARPRFAYFPFGGGVRRCIGEGFAWMEGILLLATIGQHWKIRLVKEHPVVPQPLITLRPKHGVAVTLERRM
tara:strand:+ start:14699 stop:15934 length:1236 start_codon:yes stop_codon:yes gene_type:complete